MAPASYDPAASLATARAQYFAVNGFGDDGGYGDPWVDFKLGPLPLPFPNTAGRRRAVAYHDLHHIVTGYDTNLAGELEISAWELGAGCRDFFAAWVLNLGGIALGAVVAPRRTFRAFARGRRSRSLYGQPLEPLLAGSVADARRASGVDDIGVETQRSDLPLFLLAWAAGSAVGAISMTMVSALLPLAVLTRYLHKRDERKATWKRS